MSKSCIDDWENYPMILGNEPTVGSFYDLASYNQRIKIDSRRMFVEGDLDTSIKVFEFVRGG